MAGTPEERARQNIDALLEQCGWLVQERAQANLNAALGVALCEITFDTGVLNYTLFVDGKAIGIVKAKPEGPPAWPSARPILQVIHKVPRLSVLF